MIAAPGVAPSAATTRRNIERKNRCRMAISLFDQLCIRRARGAVQAGSQAAHQQSPRHLSGQLSIGVVDHPARRQPGITRLAGFFRQRLSAFAGHQRHRMTGRTAPAARPHKPIAAVIAVAAEYQPVLRLRPAAARSWVNAASPARCISSNSVIPRLHPPLHAPARASPPQARQNG